VLYVGSDPGTKGAAAVLYPDGRIHSVCRYEKTSLPDIATFFRELADANDLTVLSEQVASRTGQGVRSMFTFGRNVGHVEGFWIALQIPFDFVTPQVWQAAHGIPHRGTRSKNDHKKVIREFAQQRRWPKYDVTADIADALMIADYARRHALGILKNSSQKKAIR